jgi:hypothetical protein
MKRIFALLAFTLVCKSLFSQACLIPGAEVQPAWVFPMWFENGDGQRDTIYFGYDTNAGYATDTLFGEKFLKVNPNVFSARFYHPLENDSNHLKVSILQEDVLGEGVSIFTQNPVLPIILTWDENAFYCDSIPFPDLDPAPRAEGHMWFDLPTHVDSCSYSFPILMTDSIDPLAYCYKSNKIVFNGPALSYLVFSIHTWDGIITNCESSQIVNEIHCFVDISIDKNEIHLISLNCEGLSIRIVDIFGRVIRFKKLSNHNEIIDISNLAIGYYVLTVIESNRPIYNTKIFKS